MPKDVPEDVLLELTADHGINKVERLTIFDRAIKEVVPTNSVKAWGIGEMPQTVSLGSLGPKDLRPFVPEPIRCYRCQQFGHHQNTCHRPVRCSFCSGSHPTKQCAEKRPKRELLIFHVQIVMEIIQLLPPTGFPARSPKNYKGSKVLFHKNKVKIKVQWGQRYDAQP